jgi:hypothetical protein
MMKLHSLALLTLVVGCTSNALLESQDEGPAVEQVASELAATTATLRIPVINHKDQRLLSADNAKLRAAGLAAFPDTVEVSGNGRTKANKSQWDAVTKLQDLAETKLPNLKTEMEAFAEPIAFQTRDPNTSICYKGNPKLVVALIESLTDSVFSDQLSVHGWRYRAIRELASEGIAMPDIWNNWRGKGEAILVVTASSDGGEETNAGLIYKCK